MVEYDRVRKGLGHVVLKHCKMQHLSKLVLELRINISIITLGYQATAIKSSPGTQGHTGECRHYDILRRLPLNLR